MSWRGSTAGCRDDGHAPLRRAAFRTGLWRRFRFVFALLFAFLPLAFFAFFLAAFFAPTFSRPRGSVRLPVPATLGSRSPEGGRSSCRVYMQAVAAVAQLDRFAVFGMFTDDFTRGFGRRARRVPLRCGDDAVQTDCENIVIRAQLYVAVATFRPGPNRPTPATIMSPLSVRSRRARGSDRSVGASSRSMSDGGIP